MSSSETIELPVGPERVKTFRGPKEVKNFIESERRAFEWLTATSRHDWQTSHPHELANNVGQVYSNLSSKVENMVDAPEEDWENKLGRVEHEFSRAYEMRGLVYSSSPRGEFIEDLRDREDDEYAALVYFYMTDVARSDRVEDLRAAFEANWFKFDDGDSREESEEQSLGQLWNKWEQRYDSLLEDTESEASDLLSFWDEQFSDVRSEQEDLQQSITEKDQEFSDLLSSAESDLDDLTDEYRDQIALLAPVEYWDDKAYTHSFWSKIWGGVAALAGILAGITFIRQAQTVLGSEGQPNYAELIVLLTFASLGIWGLRLLVKLFTSHVRLQRDARERSVMLQSFLAMLKEGHIDEEEKDTILSTLFRPAQDQSISGDSTPNNAPGLVSRLMSSK